MFNIGDSVIYPAHGIAQVEAIERRKLAGDEVDFYVLRIIKKNMSVRVPTSNEDKVGLRRVIQPEEVGRVFEILEGRAVRKYTQWHHRYSENFEKLKTGSIFSTAEVVRDLSALKRKKNLAIKESRMMDDARGLIVSEIAFTQNVPEEQIAEKVDRLLSV